MKDYSSERLKLVTWVKEILIGEKLDDDILIINNPLNKYTVGILYPNQSNNYESLQDETLMLQGVSELLSIYVI